jgi:hypothetical protein
MTNNENRKMVARNFCLEMGGGGQNRLI